MGNESDTSRTLFALRSPEGRIRVGTGPKLCPLCPEKDHILNRCLPLFSHRLGAEDALMAVYFFYVDFVMMGACCVCCAVCMGVSQS